MKHTKHDTLAIDCKIPGIINRGGSSPQSTPATANFAGVLEAHAQGLVSEGLAVEPSDGGSGFMSFHFDKSKPSAFTREDISNQSDRSNRAELGKQRTHGFFGRIERQITDKQFLQARTSTTCIGCNAACTKGKTTPQQTTGFTQYRN